MKKALVIIASIIFIFLISLCIAWGNPEVCFAINIFAPKMEWPAKSCRARTLYALERYPDGYAVYGTMPDGTKHWQARDKDWKWLIVDGSEVRYGNQEDFKAEQTYPASIFFRWIDEEGKR